MFDQLAGFPALLSVLPAGGLEITEIVTHLLIQLAVILFVAKMAGEIALRFLKIPPVLAELGAGAIIGPYALGALPIPFFGPLFPLPSGEAVIPVGNELFAIAQIGSIFLLFAIGLETNLRQFLRYAGPATAVAIGGVIIPFVLGAGATVFFGFAGEDGWVSPEALFMGAILTATSVGITARVLAELNKLDSPEGVTILGAAVVDDVLGILVLTVVVGISATGVVTIPPAAPELAPAAVAAVEEPHGFSMQDVGIVAGKALAFWLGLTAIGLLVAPYVEKALNRFRAPGSGLVITVALALLAAGMAEIFGLAFIIGAFSIGLALSNTDLAHRVERELVQVNHIVVPVFFVVMGMLVDVSAMGSALVFGLVLSVLAAASKVFGSGIPAALTGFNLRGATRVGVGMMPRGEVALIIAGIGLANGIIGQALFGVSILMTVLTTILALVFLIPLFRSPESGRRRPESSDDATAPSAEPAEEGGSHG